MLQANVSAARGGDEHAPGRDRRGDSASRRVNEGERGRALAVRRGGGLEPIAPRKGASDPEPGDRHERDGAERSAADERAEALDPPRLDARRRIQVRLAASLLLRVLPPDALVVRVAALQNGERTLDLGKVRRALVRPGAGGLGHVIFHRGGAPIVARSASVPQRPSTASWRRLIDREEQRRDGPRHASRGSRHEARVTRLASRGSRHEARVTRRALPTDRHAWPARGRSSRRGSPAYRGRARIRRPRAPSPRRR